MTERELDSSLNEYIEIETSENDIKQAQWDMAIGLQEVDNLTPSEYLERLSQENIMGEKTIEEVKSELKKYYGPKNKDDKTIKDEFECDLVSTKIVQLLEDDDFELSVEYLKYIHKCLFEDVYEFAGEFRKVDFSKSEIILNNDTVDYGDCRTLKRSLEYEMALEKEKDYEEMNIVEVLNSLANFTSKIWQTHPFREGNTRATAVFMEKYLTYLGFPIDNDIFKDESVYFRNALVRSNYHNKYMHIKEDNSYLIRFYENLLLGKNNDLDSRDLIVEELFSEKSKQRH